MTVRFNKPVNTCSTILRKGGEYHVLNQKCDKVMFSWSKSRADKVAIVSRSWFEQMVAEGICEIL